MEKDYNINIFRPKTEYQKKNTKLIFTLIAVWAVAVFGFQFSLIMLQKPTPEKAYTAYTQAIEQIQNGSATSADQIELSKAYLTVMTKYANLRKNDTLKKAFTLSISQLNQNQPISAEKAQILLALPENSLLAQAVPFGISDEIPTGLTTDEKTEISNIMKKYLIHNRSVLTDTTFLGFPFHYFYTAVFLLILFVCICLFYCYITQKTNEALNINEDSE